ncbi:MAG TPA: hypothetical protein DCQ83_01690 [Fibrobacteres bacterium]|jgi:hypothetical protein|nr:hypothetical protein [Fibrobacterota bacterium]
MAKQDFSSNARTPAKDSSTPFRIYGMRVSPKTVMVAALLVLSGLALGIFLGQRGTVAIPKGGANWATGKVEKANPGPWGDIEYLPMTISAPEELLKVKGVEEARVKWVFRGLDRAAFVRLLDSLKVSETIRAQWLSSLSMGANGVTIMPSRESVVGLAPEARQGIYRELRSPDNDNFKWEYLASDVDSYGEEGVPSKAISNLKTLSAPYGKFLLCYALPYVLSEVSTHEEKAKLIKALSRQRTMLMKLRVKRETDIQALQAYWGKTMYATDVKTILESMKKSAPSEGGLIDVIELLPPFPTSLLYTYPVPQNPLSGPVVDKNCTWTAFNFFRDTPDPKFSDPRYVSEKLASDYYPIQSDPRYGDIVVLLMPGDLLLHAAVYLADDMVYTKNGNNPWHPWMLTSVSNLVEDFSYSVSPEQKLSVVYFRNKYY